MSEIRVVASRIIDCTNLPIEKVNYLLKWHGAKLDSQQWKDLIEVQTGKSKFKKFLLNINYFKSERSKNE